MFTILSGSHAQFLEYEQANRTFLTLSNYYRYMVSKTLSVGFANTLSYTDLKLSDSEGAALPIDQFKAISDRFRFYGQYNISKRSRLSLGIFMQVFDVEEITGEDSLDYQTKGFDLASRFIFSPQKSLVFKYRLSRIVYADRKALNRDLVSNLETNAGNPALELSRQEVSAKLKLQRTAHISFNIRLKVRINDDVFQDHLSYRQVEFKAGFERSGRSFFDLSLNVLYRNRRYTDRENEIDLKTLLEENFIIVDLKLTRNIWAWLWFSLRQGGTWKSSNGPEEGFKNQQTLLSLEAQW